MGRISKGKGGETILGKGRRSGKALKGRGKGSQRGERPGKGSQQGKGGKDLSEEREKIPGREKASGGKGGKDLNRERGQRILGRKREKI